MRRLVARRTAPPGRFTVGPEDLEPHIDENTIGTVAVVGTTFTGDGDDVAGIDAMLAELAGRGLEVPLHIDAASGGFVFPFSDPDFAWDFRLESVKSINVSGHKFGRVYPGVGWLVFRDDQQLPEDLVFYEDYLGERDATFTLNFSGSSSFILAQYYNFVRHGRAGHESLVRAMDANASSLAQRRGWMVPAYQLPPANEDQQVMRMLVKINQTRELVDALTGDFHESIAHLRERAVGGPGRGRVHNGHGY